MLKDLLAQRRQLNKQIRKEALNGAANFLSGAAQVTGKAVAKVPGALWKGAKTVGKGGFAVAGLAVGGAIKGGKLIGKGVVNGAKAVAKVPGQVASVFKAGATKVAEVATTGFSKAKGLLGNLKDGIAGKAQAVGRGLANAAQVTGKAVAKVPGALWKGAKAVGKGGFAVAGLAVGGAIKGGQLIGKGVVNGAKAVAKVPGQVAGVFKSGATKVAEVATTGFSKAKGLLGKLKDGIAGKAQAVGRTVRNGIEVTKVAASKAKSFVANGANTAIMGGKNLAKNIGQGIANGSRAAAGAIRSAGKAVANSQMVKTTQRYAQTGAQIYMANKARAMG